MAQADLGGELLQGLVEDDASIAGNQLEVGQDSIPRELDVAELEGAAKTLRLRREPP